MQNAMAKDYDAYFRTFYGRDCSREEIVQILDFLYHQESSDATSSLVMSGDHSLTELLMSEQEINDEFTDSKIEEAIRSLASQPTKKKARSWPF